MAISVADAALLRNARHQSSLTLNAVPLIPIATAQINQATFAYPCPSITVDNPSANWLTDVKVGMAFSVGSTAGGSDITWGVVRKVNSGTTFYPDAKSLGDAGYASDIREGYADDQYVTVYAHRPLWSLLSRVANKVFYKQHDIAYSDQGSSPPPVVNIGQHRDYLLTGIETDVQLAFSAANSFAWGAKTMSSYSWAVEDYAGGVSAFIGGSTGESVTIEFDPGFYVVLCTGTDSASKTQTALRYVWVNEATSANAPFGVTHAFTISNDNQDRVGRRVGIAVYGDVDTDEIYPGQAYLLTEAATYGGEALGDSAALVSASYVGYIPDAQITRELKFGQIDLSLEAPMHFARRLGAASQYLIEKASPADWTQCTSALSHPPGALWYILQHHAPAFFTNHDYLYDAGIADMRRQVFKFEGATSIGSQIDKLQDMGLGVVGSQSDGTTVFRTHALYLENDDRNTLDNLFTWNETDIEAPLNIPFNFNLPVGVVRGYAFSYAGGTTATPYASRAPGATQSQGTGQSDFTFTVTASDGQTKVNRITGHRFALENGKTQPFTTAALGNIDIANPCDVHIWHTLNIPAAYNPLGFGIENVRVLPMRVTRQWKVSERGGLVKRVQIEWQRETFGQPGITVPVDRGAASNWLSQVQIPVDYDPKFLNAFVVAWNTAGDLVRSLNFNTATPHFEAIDDGLTGDVNDFAPDYGSEFFEDGVGTLGAWVVTTSGTTLRVYYAADIRTVLPTWTLQTSTTMADSTVDGSARIASSKTTVGFVVTAWRAQTGTRVLRSTDGGSTWGSVVTVGDTASDTGNDNAELGFAIDGVNQLVTARHTDGDYYLYLATATGGSFSQVASSPSDSAPFPLIQVDGQGNAYIVTASAAAPPSADYLVTYDAGGYGSYTIYYGSETTGGNPDDCAAIVSTLPFPATLLETCVALTGSTDLTSWTIEYDWSISWTGTPHSLDTIRPWYNPKTGSCGASGVVGGTALSAARYPNTESGINGVWQHDSGVISSGTYDRVTAALQLNHYASSGATYTIKIDNIELTAP